MARPRNEPNVAANGTKPPIANPTEMPIMFCSATPQLK
jgi:hypothetical protein